MACTFKVYDCLGDGLKWGLGQTGEALANGAVETFAKAIGEGASEVLKALNGVWMGIKMNDAGGPATTIMNETSWLVAYVAVASILFAAMRTAFDRKGQPMKQAFMGMWKVILVSGLAVSVVQSLNVASDAYAAEVYGKSHLGDKAAEMLGVMVLRQPGLVLIFGLLVMLSSFVQICLMYIRIGVLIMLIGTLPLAAASSMTGWGEGWWKKHIGWLAAWLLYKPAAALIIYSATTMTSTKNANGDADLNATIAGMGMLILSVFALPALLKLIVPATAALGGTSGGTIALGATNNIASGAVSIAAGSAGGGGGGGGGSAGPQGSPSSGAGSSAGGASAGGAGGAAGGAGMAAAGAATGGAALAVQAAAVVVQTGVQAASQVAGSLDDNDGMKGHNQ
ncbi:hypothetical protein [Streptomyces sp. NBC_01236]|uniref:hypothetical protein n=1 Tax=Streptomyces sp. NBC_01236 TaxID=2903789 RepID=UPI002E0FF0B7|nr:hypothetical protein OG324_29115 [Streptomyces sp. NBC_01236]